MEWLEWSQYHSKVVQPGHLWIWKCFEFEDCVQWPFVFLQLSLHSRFLSWTNLTTFILPTSGFFLISRGLSTHARQPFDWVFPLPLDISTLILENSVGRCIEGLILGTPMVRPQFTALRKKIVCKPSYTCHAPVINSPLPPRLEAFQAHTILNSIENLWPTTWTSN